MLGNRLKKIIVIDSGYKCRFNERQKCIHLDMDGQYCVDEINEDCPLEDYTDKD